MRQERIVQFRLVQWKRSQSSGDFGKSIFAIQHLIVR